jgi:tRNA threonylcarbamoyladenosine biosynthesis protein TsaB
MILLGIETSTRRSSVALTQDGDCLFEVSHDAPRGHGVFLGPAVRAALDAAGAPPDGVAVGTGPGLYTGLRVGMVTAIVFAAARRVPMVGIGGLDVLIARARLDGVTGPVVATLDARRGQVFWRVDRPDDPAAPDGPVVGAQATLDALLAEFAHAGTPAHVVGEVGVSAPSWPSAVDLLTLAAPRFAHGDTVAPDALRPVYLRDADVRIGWTERTVPAGAP